MRKLFHWPTKAVNQASLLPLNCPHTLPKPFRVSHKASPISTPGRYNIAIAEKEEGRVTGQDRGRKRAVPEVGPEALASSFS